MGEIKSTLELVMARTRHLSLSDEEKARQQQADFDKRLQGLLQQYSDGALSVDALQDRITALQVELKLEDPHMLAGGVARRIDPDQDNQCWLDLLRETAPALCGPLKAVLVEFSASKRERLQAGERRLRQDLAEGHGIAGPAVVPNAQKDRACRAELAALRQQALDRLEAVVNQAMASDQT